eukprot:1154581_1
MMWVALFIAAFFTLSEGDLNCKGMELNITHPTTSIQAYPANVCLAYNTFLMGQSFWIECTGNTAELRVYSTSNDCTGGSSVTTFEDIFAYLNPTLTSTSYCDQSAYCPLITSRIYENDDCSGDAALTSHTIQDYCLAISSSASLSTCNGSHVMTD